MAHSTPDLKTLCPARRVGIVWQHPKLIHEGAFNLTHELTPLKRHAGKGRRYLYRSPPYNTVKTSSSLIANLLFTGRVHPETGREEGNDCFQNVEANESFTRLRSMTYAHLQLCLPRDLLEMIS